MADELTPEEIDAAIAAIPRSDGPRDRLVAEYDAITTAHREPDLVDAIVRSLVDPADVDPGHLEDEPC